MQDTGPLTVSVAVDAPPSRAWSLWNDPGAICQWFSGHPDWHTPRAENELRAGGRFRYRMEAKDGSAGFDFEGTYDEIRPEEAICYTIADGRKVAVTFHAEGAGTRVREVFDPEGIHSRELQQEGWQAVLDNFRAFVARA